VHVCPPAHQLISPRASDPAVNHQRCVCVVHDPSRQHLPHVRLGRSIEPTNWGLAKPEDESQYMDQLYALHRSACAGGLPIKHLSPLAV